MKKKLFGLTLVSLALFLGACGSSAPQTSSDSAEGDAQQEETPAEQTTPQQMPGTIRFDDFELTYTEKDTGLGYNGVYVSLTNNTDNFVLNGKITYTLKPGVTAEDVTAAMPADFPFDPDAYDRMSNNFWTEKNPVTLEPSETSPEFAVMINTPMIDNPEMGFIEEVPATKEVMDLLEVKELKVEFTVDGTLKEAWLEPGQMYPVSDLMDSFDTLNGVVEGAEDLIPVPDGVSLYTTGKPNIPDNVTHYVFTFYDLEPAVMEKLIEEFKALYPGGHGGDYNYYRSDQSPIIMMNWDEEMKIVSGEIQVK